jgi:hypothetical protein
MGHICSGDGVWRVIYRILVGFLHEKITELVLHRIGLQAVQHKSILVCATSSGH